MNKTKIYESPDVTIVSLTGQEQVLTGSNCESNIEALTNCEEEWQGKNYPDSQHLRLCKAPAQRKTLNLTNRLTRMEKYLFWKSALTLLKQHLEQKLPANSLSCGQRAMKSQ